MTYCSVTAATSLVAGGAWFAWPTPLLPHLLAPDSPVPMTPDEVSWMVSCVEVGCLVVPFPAVYISDNYGRKFCMLLSVPLYLFAALLINHVKTFASLSFARFLIGAGMCIPYTILPLYLGEIASPEVRGAVTSFYHIAWSLGCLIPYCIGPYLSFETYNYAIFSIGLLFLALFIWQPESPYFYALQKNSVELTNSLKRLRDSPSEDSIQMEIKEIETEVMKSQEERGSWRDVIATPADRRALLLLMALGTVSFLSGQNAILTYTTETTSLLPTIISPDVITIMVGVVMVFASVLSLFLSDLFGRRFLILSSSIGCTVCLAATSVYFFLYFNLERDVADFSWIAPLALLGFNFFLTFGMHPVCVTYSSELFPTNTRGVANGILGINITFCSFFVLKTYEPITNSFGIYFVYLIYTAVCLAGTIFFYFMMPETKGKSFLEIKEDLIKYCNTS